MEAPFAAAAAFDYVAGTDWEPTGQTICLRTRSLPSHMTALLLPPYPGTNARWGRQFRDGTMARRNSCELLWIAGGTGEGLLQGAYLGARSEQSDHALKDRSRCSGPSP